MNILIAPDKFKGSLSALEVCTSIQAGLRHNYPAANIELAPLADGGDGTLAILSQYLADLRPCELTTVNPLGKTIKATYLETNEAAFIEIASASGLVLLESSSCNPMITSTFGTGVQLLNALQRGKQKVTLLLGGSATNDLGLGIAAALGFLLLDRKGQPLKPCGANLLALHEIVPPLQRPWEDMEITLLCDVVNPLCGPNGAAHVYAAQKGATPAMIEQLEQGAVHAANVLAHTTDRSIINLPGGGAAGGIAAGLVALLDARLQSGFGFVTELAGLKEKIARADIVISGEGQLDGQSLQGKAVGGVLELCATYGKPCYLFTGRNALATSTAYAETLKEVNEIMAVAPTEKSAMQQAGHWLTELAGKLVV